MPFLPRLTPAANVFLKTAFAPIDHPVSVCTYVETAEFDCLRDEGLACTRKVARTGVLVIIRRTAGTFHGWDMAFRASPVQECVRERIRFLNRMFSYD